MLRIQVPSLGTFAAVSPSSLCARYSVFYFSQVRLQWVSVTTGFGRVSACRTTLACISSGIGATLDRHRTFSKKPGMWHPGFYVSMATVMPTSAPTSSVAVSCSTPPATSRFAAAGPQDQGVR